MDIAERVYDSYEIRFGTDQEEEMIREIQLMEKNSQWIHDIRTSELRLEPFEGGFLVIADDIAANGFDVEAAKDTAENTKLLLVTDFGKELVRDTAVNGIEIVGARLNGQALREMSRRKYCETLNNGFEVARGDCVLLRRFEKLSGFYSSSYEIMPISKLVDVAADKLVNRFGELRFEEGVNTHGYTACRWKIPDAQNMLITKYKEALNEQKTKFDVDRFMPAIKFQSSDTSTSCATLAPVFITPDGNEIALVEPAKVKHMLVKDKNGERVSGIDRFANEADGLFAKFEDSAQAIAKLASVQIENPCNAVVSICKEFKIPKRYGTAARDLAERIAYGEPFISGHDLYICLTEALSEAKRREAGRSVINQLEDALSRAVRCNMKHHDVSGSVAWGKE